MFGVLKPCTITSCVIFDAHHPLTLANHRFGGLIVRLSIDLSRFGFFLLYHLVFPCCVNVLLRIFFEVVALRLSTSIWQLVVEFAGRFTAASASCFLGSANGSSSYYGDVAETAH